VLEHESNSRAAITNIKMLRRAEITTLLMRRSAPSSRSGTVGRGWRCRS